MFNPFSARATVLSRVAALSVLAFFPQVCSARDAQSSYSPPQLVLHRGHSSAISAIEFAHRKHILVTGSQDGSIKLWEIASGLELDTLPAEGTAVRGLAIFPSDERLAAGYRSGMVAIWDLDRRRRVTALNLGEPVWRIALSKDGHWVAAASDKGKIEVWNTLTLQPVLKLNDVQTPTHLAFTTDGALRATNRFSYDTQIDHADIEWAVPSGRVLRQRSHVVPIALSADGKELLSVPNDRVGEHDIATLSDETGSVLAEWPFATSHDEDIADADLSPDGKMLVTAGMSLSGNAHEFTYVRVLDAHMGNVLHTLAGRDENAAMNLLVKFSPDGRTIAVVAENDVTMFDAASGLRSGQIAWAGRPNFVKFSPAGHWLAVVVRRTLKLWDLASGELAMNLGPVSGAARVAFSPDDRYIASWNFDPATLNLQAVMKRYQVKIWDLEDGGEVHTPSEEGPLNDIVFSPDGRELAYSINASVVLCDSSTGAVLRRMRESLSYGTRHWLSFSTDGSEIFDFSDRYDFHSWSTRDGRLLKKWEEPGAPQGTEEAIADGQGEHLFAYSDYAQTIRLWSPNLHASAKVTEKHIRVQSLAFDPKMTTLVVGSNSDRELVFYDVPSLHERRRITLPETVASLGYSPDGKWLAIAMVTGEIALYDLATLQLAATLVAMGSTSDWMIVTQDGEFDGSQRGLHTLMAWQFRRTQYPIDHFYQDFYAPRLLPRILNGEILKPKLSIEALGFPPAVQIVSHKIWNAGDQVQMRVRASDQGGGLKELRLYQNGKLVAAHALNSGQQQETHADFRITLAHGENRFGATAVNNRGVESNEDVLWVEQASTSQKPVLHVLAVGISRYANRALDLDYPRTDSEALAEALRRHSSNLFSHVDVIALADSAATEDGIRGAFRKLASETSADDAVIVYLAGHGSLVGNQFYFFGHDAELGNMGASNVVKSGISAREIGVLLQRTSAIRQFLILDSCESGGAIAQLDTIGHLKAGQTLSRNIGIHVLAATGAAQREKEMPGIAHGSLAQSLLEGVGASGPAKAPANPAGVITVEALSSFVKLRHAQLVKQYGGTNPESISSDSGPDFAIAKQQ